MLVCAIIAVLMAIMLPAIEVFSNVVDCEMKKGGVLLVYQVSPTGPRGQRSTPP
jgi:hypothetical protein